MDAPSFLRHLRHELAAFRACLDGDLSVPIEHCSGWTLRDLAAHLGGSNLWAAAAVTEQRGDYEPPAAPTDPAELLRWFDESSEVLLRALDVDPGTSAWTFHSPHTVGFWQRRRCLEALVHRWDAEHALGTPRPLNAELAGEGVAEVFDTMAPRQVARGRAEPPAAALRLDATDTGASWTYGPGAPVAVLSGSAPDLLLLLWGRLPRHGASLTWQGDQQAGQRILDGPLTP
ncbi:maleylpyruvate isomerase family mycothiol-dependent enzyme [Micromonospora sp. DR5-3]|uniref:maleylpyruvate isomerase family mycothiol-dependent enzyme n=1 Tax=unclassified Micromonospora TaxID=2617518 RepID=UPI0011D45143|nr:MULTISPECIES: maleylpyruvate isomerase family mycothiol-dependent enzyme [unclassified Micromonospora]MCW3813816.1 maleylpyruvate isomerase family mycothiol-dependent enzyme [Micromonospora sp. DR5-3]TYC25506.1 maleylpyruvate isomerase family mycothiol-dependent enzyme [Micromonospora sp. MP36]